jgi:DNA-binding MarR family transcriptional regulator
MASTFFLKNLPTPHVLEDMSRRYPDLKPSAVESMLNLLRVASDILEAFDTRMAKNKMSQGKFCVMMQLLRNPGKALSPSDLADNIGVARATITGLVDGLEKAGLVRRERGGTDRRSHSVRLTPKGSAFLDAMLPRHYQRTGKVMGRLSEQERRTLVVLLSKVATGLKEAEELA